MAGDQGRGAVEGKARRERDCVNTSPTGPVLALRSAADRLRIEELVGALAPNDGKFEIDGWQSRRPDAARAGLPTMILGTSAAL